ncbi:MAG TPA: hypothetical protein VN727_13425 [Candidatus Binatia bacterium]|nr:hypothetical protein [Candidatus Binatia bacterium]
MLTIYAANVTDPITVLQAAIVARVIRSRAHLKTPRAFIDGRLAVGFYVAANSPSSRAL